MQSVVHQAETSAPSGPDFLVGQDCAGHWLAVETKGRRGGIFVTRDAALDYARSETDRRPDAVVLAPAPLALL